MEKSPKYKDFLTSVTDSKVFKEWRKGKGFDTDKAYMADKIAQYREVGKELTDSQAQQEMIANFVAEVLYKSDKSINRFVDALSSSQKKTFKTFLSDLIEWFKGKVGGNEEVARLEKAYAELFKGAKETSPKTLDNSKDAEYNEDGTPYAYNQTVNVGGYDYTLEQYNNFGWVRANNVINAGYWRNFTENFAQAVKGNYKYPKNKNGEYMIEVYDAYDSSGITDVIVFASGTIESPNITKIVKIDLTNDIDIETKRRVLYETERRGIQQKTGKLFRFYNKTDFVGKLRQQRTGYERDGDNNGLNIKRSASETKANRIVEFHIDEESGTITTTYANGEVITEKLGEDETSYSYTPTKAERIAALVDQYDSGVTDVILSCGKI